MPVFFRNKEKGLVLISVEIPRYIERPAQCSAGLILLVERRAPGLIEKVARVENVIPCKEIPVAMKLVATTLRRGQNRAGRASSIHSAVIRGKHLQFIDCVHARKDN